MRRKSRVFFEARGLVPGELSGRLLQFGCGTCAPRAVSLRVVSYDTQDGSLFKRGATLRFCAEAPGDRGWWLIKQKDATLEWVIGTMNHLSGERSSFAMTSSSLRARTAMP